ncbi:MAG: cyclic nucleotide-gated ion channel [Hyphomicrobium sp.]
MTHDQTDQPHRDRQTGGRAVGGLTLRRRVYQIVENGRGEDKLSRWFDGFIVTLIVANIAAFIAETVPAIGQRHAAAFHAFDTFSVAIFSVEYLLRLWTAVEVPYLARLSPARARWQMATRPSLIIDLIAIAPFYLSALFSIDLRALRVLRLLRFLKLSRYSPAMYTLIRVLSNERKALMGAVLLLATAILFSSTAMYYIEGTIQPDKFGTVPDAAWWSIATLTTVGYGDVTPITPLGRFIGALTMVAGLCVLALPVAIISTGFAQELSRRDFVVNWSLMSRVPLLAELDAKEAAELMPLLHAHNLPPNVEIVPKGAKGDAMYFIASGRVEHTIDEACRVFETGDAFGVFAMLENDVHLAPFVTSSKVKLLKLHKEDFHRIEMRNPRLASHIRELAHAQKR